MVQLSSGKAKRKKLPAGNFRPKRRPAPTSGKVAVKGKLGGKVGSK